MFVAMLGISLKMKRSALLHKNHVYALRGLQVQVLGT